MINAKRIAKSSFLVGLMGLVLGCVVEPREGFYDHDHHRYYHEHTWHECHEGEAFCR
jgi:hypothetical protein